LTLLALAFAYSLSADRAAVTHFSRLLAIDVDLGQCAAGFSKLLMAQTIFLIAVDMATLVALLLICSDIYTLKRSFRLYRKPLLIFAVCAAMLVVPLLNHDGAWMAGGGRGFTRVSLEQACAASGKVTFYRLHLQLVITALWAFAVLFAAFILRRLVVLGRDPNRLSDKPEVRAMQLAMKKSSQKRLDTLKSIFKFAVCALAAYLFVAGSASLGISFWRAYHYLTWPRQLTTIEAIGTQCILEKRARRGGWTDHSVVECSDAEAIRHAYAWEEPRLEWHVRSRLTAELSYQRPDGSVGTAYLGGDLILPAPLPVGSEVIVLRNPDNPDDFDRVFDRRDTIKTSLRLLIVVLSAVAGYFLLVRKPPDQRSSTA
jgi:hypothetical protein